MVRFAAVAAAAEGGAMLECALTRYAIAPLSNASIPLVALWGTREVQNLGCQIGVLESLDDARAFGVVFGDIFKGTYKLKRMGCYIAASDKLQYITVRSIGEACCH